jgi:hypothetical protein
MNDEDRVFMHVLPRWVIGMVLMLLLLFFMADMFSRAYNLTWFPWQIKMTDHYDPQPRSGAA